MRFKSVQADPKNFTLTITWANGAVTRFDLSTAIKRRPEFKVLADRKLFAKATVVDGSSIGWGPAVAAEIDADELWARAAARSDGFPSDVMKAEEFRAWMARCGYSLDTAAAALDLSRRTVANFRSGEAEIPRVVKFACLLIEDWLRGQPPIAAD